MTAIAVSAVLAEQELPEDVGKSGPLGLFLLLVLLVAAALLVRSMTGHLKKLPRTKALHEAILATGAESPYTEWLANWDPAHDISHRVTTRVPCAEFFPQRDAALIAHATQIDPEGRWFACPIDTQQRVWPTEDYELARSLVDVPVPEDDLFAGVRSEVVVR